MITIYVQIQDTEKRSPIKRGEHRTMMENFFSFDDNYTCIDSGCSNNSKQNKYFLRKSIARHFIEKKKWMKTSAKEKDLKTEKKDTLCTSNKNKMTVDYSSETMQARK